MKYLIFSSQNDYNHVSDNWQNVKRQNCATSKSNLNASGYKYHLGERLGFGLWPVLAMKREFAMRVGNNFRHWRNVNKL